MAKPGRSHREGITLMQLGEMFPDEAAAHEWFETIVWPNGRTCPRCRGDNTYRGTHKTMPYHCRPCKRFFSVRTGTAMQSSKLPLRMWAYAIYLEMTSLKGVSSMKLHRDLGIKQDTAWHLQHRIRTAFIQEIANEFEGPVEVDEAYFGGLEKNKHASKKANLGRGPVGKTAVVGMRDRNSNSVAARVVNSTDKPTLQGFVREHAEDGAKVYTDDSCAYKSLENHESVKHSVGEYVNGQAHTNGVESFWAVLKRAYHGVYHQISPKHLQRYVDQFAGKHNVRHMDTLEQMPARRGRHSRPQAHVPGLGCGFGQMTGVWPRVQSPTHRGC